MSLSATEEVDEFIDQNIQINTNKQMRDEFLYAWTLKFKDPNQEQKFGQLREDMFRSNMLCVFIIWLMIVVCQSIIVSSCTTLFIFLGVATLIMMSLLVLVMAEEFDVCPEVLAKSSTSLVHHRNRRSVFICCVIVLMAVGSAIALLLCPFQPFPATPENATSTDIENRGNGNPTSSGGGGGQEMRVNVFLTATIHHNITINTNQSNATLDTILAGESLLNGTTNTDTPAASNGSGIDWAKLVSLSQLQTQLKHAISVRDVGSANSFLNELLRQRNFNKSQGGARQLDGQVDEDGVALTTNVPPLGDDEHVTGAVDEETGSYGSDNFDSCSHPEYLVFSWVLCLIALATALKLYYIIKTIMAGELCRRNKKKNMEPFHFRI